MTPRNDYLLVWFIQREQVLARCASWWRRRVMSVERKTSLMSIQDKYRSHCRALMITITLNSTVEIIIILLEDILLTILQEISHYWSQYISLSEMKTSVLLGLFLLASLSLSRDVHLHLSLPGRDSLRSEGPSPDSIQKDPSYSQWTLAQRRWP